MTQFYIKFRVEVDETYDAVHDFFKGESVSIAYWKSSTGLDHVEYIVGPVQEIGVDNWKESFDGLGCKYTADIREVI